MDGSQKLPQRILDPLFENLKSGKPYAKLLTVVAAWIRFLEARSLGGAIDDPFAAQLLDAVQGPIDDVHLVGGILDLDFVFKGYPVDQIFEELTARCRDLSPQNIEKYMGKVLS